MPIASLRFRELASRRDLITQANTCDQSDDKRLIISAQNPGEIWRSRFLMLTIAMIFYSRRSYCLHQLRQVDAA